MEQVFLEVRCWVEGVVYGGDIAAKVRVVEGVLEALASDGERVRSLMGWDWLVEVLGGGGCAT